MSRIGCRTLLYWNRFRWNEKYGMFYNYTNQIVLQKSVIEVFEINFSYKKSYVHIVIGSTITMSIHIFHFWEKNIKQDLQLTNYNDLYKYIVVAMDYIDKI
jgi:hypothetical protein